MLFLHFNPFPLRHPETHLRAVAIRVLMRWSLLPGPSDTTYQTARSITSNTASETLKAPWVLQVPTPHPTMAWYLATCPTSLLQPPPWRHTAFLLWGFNCVSGVRKWHSPSEKTWAFETAPMPSPSRLSGSRTLSLGTHGSNLFYLSTKENRGKHHCSKSKSEGSMSKKSSVMIHGLSWWKHQDRTHIKMILRTGIWAEGIQEPQSNPIAAPTENVSQDHSNSESCPAKNNPKSFSPGTIWRQDSPSTGQSPWTLADTTGRRGPELSLLHLKIQFCKQWVPKAEAAPKTPPILGSEGVT